MRTNLRVEMVNPNRFYTYAYLREDRTPYYVGKGCGDRIRKRKRTDIKPPKDKSRIIFLKQNLTEENAYKHEIYMISVFGRKDLGTGILYNKTNGGDGVCNMSEKTKQKIKEKRAKQVFSDETREKIRKALKGKRRPPEVIEKIKQGRTGIKHTEEAKQKIKEKRANQVFSETSRKKLSDLHKGKSKPHLWKKFELVNSNGELIKEVNITKFCKENNLKYDCILKVLNGKQIQHKGWKMP